MEDIRIVNNLNKKLGLCEIQVCEDELPEEENELDFWDIDAVQDQAPQNMADIATRARSPTSIASHGTGGK